MKRLRSVLDRAFPVWSPQLCNFRLLSVVLGQAHTIATGKRLDAEGRPIHWYTYPRIEYLRQFDFSQAAAFAYGSGNSSLFWAARAREVVSVEVNPAWYDYVSKASSPNQTVLLRQQKSAYASSLAEQGG